MNRYGVDQIDLYLRSKQIGDLLWLRVAELDHVYASYSHAYIGLNYEFSTKISR